MAHFHNIDHKTQTNEIAKHLKLFMQQKTFKDIERHQNSLNTPNTMKHAKKAMQNCTFRICTIIHVQRCNSKWEMSREFFCLWLVIECVGFYFHAYWQLNVNGITMHSRIVEEKEEKKTHHDSRFTSQFKCINN